MFDASYGNHPTALSWKLLTDVSAIGGMLLFVSALFFVLVMVFTLFGSIREVELVEFAEALEAPGPRALMFDRLGLWTAAAVILVLVAYGPPLWNHLQLARYGSAGFSPF